MQTDSPSADEARRALAQAVVSDWTAWLRQTGKEQPSLSAKWALAGLIFEAFEILDDPEAHGSDPALRAQPERAGKAMRERCAKLCEDEAADCLTDIVPDDEPGAKLAHARASALLTAAIDLRALPLTDDEGGGA